MLTFGSLGGHSAASSTCRTIQHDPRELPPAGPIARTPLLLMVRNALPARTLAEFSELARIARMACPVAKSELAPPTTPPARCSATSPGCG